ncbi:type II toxin-antitoxin system VapC family toxin [soil metagenome]
MGNGPVNLLLDTHVWVWAIETPDRLGPKTRKALLNPSIPCAVCSVSTLELARLVSGGDLVLEIPLAQWVEQSLRDLRADSLPVSNEVALEAYDFPAAFHRDPADRQIVACARLHGLQLVTADDRILRWEHVASLDARK